MIDSYKLDIVQGYSSRKNAEPIDDLIKLFWVVVNVQMGQGPGPSLLTRCVPSC